MMEELNMKYLRDERNWFFEEKFSKDKVIENSVWPAKVVHQNQVLRRKKEHRIFLYKNLIYNFLSTRLKKPVIVELNFNGN